MRRHRFISMAFVVVRRSTTHRRLRNELPARLKPIRRKHMRRKRV